MDLLLLPVLCMGRSESKSQPRAEEQLWLTRRSYEVTLQAVRILRGKDL